MADQKIAKCPECGGRCWTTISGTFNDWQVACETLACRYISGAKPTESEAIAAHNTVSDAVATQPDLLDKLDRLATNVRAFTSASGYKVCDYDFLNECVTSTRKAKGDTDG